MSTDETPSLTKDRRVMTAATLMAMMIADAHDPNQKADLEAHFSRMSEKREKDAADAKARYAEIAKGYRDERARRKAIAWEKRQPKPKLTPEQRRQKELEEQWIDLSIRTPLTHVRPCINLFPSVSQDGDQVCLLFGEIQCKRSIVGFGSTLEEAADAFDKDFYSKHTLTCQIGDEVVIEDASHVTMQIDAEVPK
jgi:hypothetical protein